MTYTILDICCGAGGASAGYAQAGFNVIGVDLIPQPDYPFTFIRADALTLMTGLIQQVPLVLYAGPGGQDIWPVDAIHVSPPCQRWSVMSKCRPGLRESYPDLITPMRPLLQAAGVPYVIENVPGAPLYGPAQLCGTSFGCRADWHGKVFEVQRHRLFETSWPVAGVSCGHVYPSLPVYGHGAPGNRRDLRGAPVAAMTRQAMGIGWMSREAMTEAIPPAYTRYVGVSLAAHLDALRAALVPAAAPLYP